MRKTNLAWVSPLAHQVAQQSDLFARLIASLMVILLKDRDFAERSLKSWGQDVLDPAVWTQLGGEIVWEKIKQRFENLSHHWATKDPSFIESEAFVNDNISPIIAAIARAIETNPQLIHMLLHIDILTRELGIHGHQLTKLLRLLPVISGRATAVFPEIREQCFKAWFRLSQDDRLALAQFAELLLKEVFNQFALPRLEGLLAQDPRGKVVLPFVQDILKLVPPDASLNILISTICTPRPQLTVNRFLSIAIQEMGGLFVKTTQILSEMCPPSLAKELRSSQDASTGVFPSVEKSFSYFMQVLNYPEVKEQWETYIEIDPVPAPHFAAASVGAIYELKLNEAGQEKYKAKTLLVKVQRPGLNELLETQATQLKDIALHIQRSIESDQSIGATLREELRGLCDALLRGINHYYEQCAAELDFRREQENADTIRQALCLHGKNEKVMVPRYFQTGRQFLIMERMPGIKITRSVQTKYLARREIADRLISTYLSLLFEHGIVWADPHPGNILLDDSTLMLSMIDLNPCFIWKENVREKFKSMLYRLLLRDVGGVLDSLYSVVTNPDALNNNKLFDELSLLMSAEEYRHGTAHYMADFIRILAENSVDMKIEVQAALRGLTQLAITATAISARNSFALEIRKYFGLRDIFNTIFDVGIFRVFRVATAIVFHHIQRTPELEIGPTLDERDIQMLSWRLRELRKAGVCEIRFRRVSPEEHANLHLTPDGAALMVSSDLQLVVLDGVRPARVRYIIELPSSTWLKERQEFVKLTSLARNFTIIECLEQFRRKSLDDYWRTVEAWRKPAHQRTVNEVSLIGEVRVAARRLLQLRFAHLWDHPLSGLGRHPRLLWRMLLASEFRRESAEQKFVKVAAKTKAQLPVGLLTVGTVHRVQILLWEGLLRLIRWKLSKYRYSMSLLPIRIDELESIILHHLGRSSSNTQNQRHNPHDASR